MTAPEHKPGKRSTFIATVLLAAAALTTPAPALADKTDDIYLAYLPALKELRYVSKHRVDDDQAGRRKLDKRVAPHGWPYLSPKGACINPKGPLATG